MSVKLRQGVRGEGGASGWVRLGARWVGGKTSGANPCDSACRPPHLPTLALVAAVVAAQLQGGRGGWVGSRLRDSS